MLKTSILNGKLWITLKETRMQTVILSINKPHTDNIFDGIKKLEVRKNFPYIESPYRVLVYETKKNKGVGAIIGEFFCPYCLCYLYPD